MIRHYEKFRYENFRNSITIHTKTASSLLLPLWTT